jgi:valine dehydrogenase (NAD+)
LQARGILYAPDYVINAGGVLQLLGLESLGWDEDELERNLALVGDTLNGLYRDADARGITPAVAADRLAAARVAEALSPS